MSQPKRDFTLQQLRTFVCAARAGSFSRAAEQLDISQPAVSDQITTLEERLGYALFSRRRGTTPLLTQEGAKLLASAETMLSTSDVIRGESAPGPRQQVRLSIGPLLRDTYLKPLLPLFYREHPEIELVMAPLVARIDIQDALEKGRVDLIVYTVGEAISSWPNVRLVSEVPTVIVARPGTRARIESGEISLGDLPFVLTSPETRSEFWIERQLERLGIMPVQPLRHIEFPDVVQQMVESGEGVSVLMYEQVAEALAAGRLEIVGPQLPPMQRFVARARSAPPATRIVELFVLRALDELPPSVRRGGGLARI